jgi:hypothetical protein
VWSSLIGLWAVVAERQTRLQTGAPNNARLAVPREVDPSEVAHAAIPVDEMPAVSADSAGCIPRPVVGVGRDGAHDIRRVGGRVIDRLEIGIRTRVKGEVAWLRTSRVPTEDALESIGDVGVEMLDGNVASEVTVGGLDGKTWDCSVPTKIKDESMDELDSDIVLCIDADVARKEESKKTAETLGAH